MMKLAVGAALLAAVTGTAFAGKTLDTIKQRDQLVCGVNPSLLDSLSHCSTTRLLYVRRAELNGRNLTCSATHSSINDFSDLVHTVYARSNGVASGEAATPSTVILVGLLDAVALVAEVLDRNAGLSQRRKR